MKKVTKAIIPAAGLGTRFLPATKSIPKEMLPIVDVPIIYHVVKEAVEAGIEDIILIQGRYKDAIENFFDISYEVQDKLEKDGKAELLNKILEVQNMANIISLRQKSPLGLGHAVACGAPITGDEPFAVLLGDEISMTPKGGKNVTQLLCESYADTGLSSVAIMEVAEKDVSKYGIIAGTQKSDGVYNITDVVEKPEPNKAPTRMALPGRYVFDGQIMKHLKTSGPGKNGEIQLTDSMAKVAQEKGMLGCTFESKRYDAGDKLGFLIANIEFGLSHPELSDGLKEYLKQLAKEI